MSGFIEVIGLAPAVLAGIGGALLGDRIGLWLRSVLRLDGRRP